MSITSGEYTPSDNTSPVVHDYNHHRFHNTENDSSTSSPFDEVSVLMNSIDAAQERLMEDARAYSHESRALQRQQLSVIRSMVSHILRLRRQLHEYATNNDDESPSPEVFQGHHGNDGSLDTTLAAEELAEMSRDELESIVMIRTREAKVFRQSYSETAQLLTETQQLLEQHDDEFAALQVRCDQLSDEKVALELTLDHRRNESASRSVKSFDAPNFAQSGREQNEQETTSINHDTIEQDIPHDNSHPDQSLSSIESVSVLERLRGILTTLRSNERQRRNELSISLQSLSESCQTQRYQSRNLKQDIHQLKTYYSSSFSAIHEHISTINQHWKDKNDQVMVKLDAAYLNNREAQGELAAMKQELLLSQTNCEQLEVTLNERNKQVKDGNKQNEALIHEIQLQKEQLEQKDEKINEILHQLDLLKSEADTKLYTHEQTQSEIGKLRTQLQQTEKERTDMQTKLQQTEQERIGLQTKLQQTEGERMDLQAKLQQIKEERTDLQTKLNDAQQSFIQLTDQLASMQSEYKHSSHEQSLTHEKLTSMQEECIQLREELASMKASNTSIQQECVQLQEKLRTGKDTNTSMQQERDQLKEDLIASKQTITTIQQEKVEFQGKLDTLYQEKLRLTNQVNSYQQELATLQTKLDLIEKKSVHTVQQTEKQTTQDQQQIEKLSNQVAILSHKLEKRQHEQAYAKQRDNQLRGAMKDRLIALQTVVTKLKHELISIRKMSDDLNCSQHTNILIQNFQSFLQEYQRMQSRTQKQHELHIIEETQQKANLQVQKVSDTFEQDLHTVQSKLETVLKENTELKTSSSNRTKLAAHLNEVKTQHQQLKLELKTHQTNEELLQNKITELDTRNQELLNEKQTLLKHVQELQEKIQSNQSDFNIKSKEFDDLQIHLSNHTNKSKTEKNKYVELQHLTTRIHILEQQLHTMHTLHEQTQQTLQDKVTELDTLKYEIQTQKMTYWCKQNVQQRKLVKYRQIFEDLVPSTLKPCQMNLMAIKNSLRAFSQQFKHDMDMIAHKTIRLPRTVSSSTHTKNSRLYAQKTNPIEISEIQTIKSSLFNLEKTVKNLDTNSKKYHSDLDPMVSHRNPSTISHEIVHLCQSTINAISMFANGSEVKHLNKHKTKTPKVENGKDIPISKFKSTENVTTASNIVQAIETLANDLIQENSTSNLSDEEEKMKLRISYRFAHRLRSLLKQPKSDDTLVAIRNLEDAMHAIQAQYKNSTVSHKTKPIPCSSTENDSSKQRKASDTFILPIKVFFSNQKLSAKSNSCNNAMNSGVDPREPTPTRSNTKVDSAKLRVSDLHSESKNKYNPPSQSHISESYEMHQPLHFSSSGPRREGIVLTFSADGDI